jgi:hypothetical protein
MLGTNKVVITEPIPIVTAHQADIRKLDTIKDCDNRTKIENVVSGVGDTSSLPASIVPFPNLKLSEHAVDSSFEAETDYVPWIKTGVGTKEESGEPDGGKLQARAVFQESGYGPDNFMMGSLEYCRNFANEVLDPLSRNFENKKCFYFPQAAGIEFIFTEKLMEYFGLKKCTISSTRKEAGNYDFEISIAGYVTKTKLIEGVQNIQGSGINIFAGNADKNAFLGITWEEFVVHRNYLYTKSNKNTTQYNVQNKTVEKDGHDIYTIHKQQWFVLQNKTVFNRHEGIGRFVANIDYVSLVYHITTIKEIHCTASNKGRFVGNEKHHNYL